MEDRKKEFSKFGDFESFGSKFNSFNENERSFKMKDIPPEFIKIKINTRSKKIIVTGEHERKTTENGVTSSSKSSVNYNFQLPNNSNVDTIESSFINGVLKITWENLEETNKRDKMQVIPIKIVKE